MNRINPIPEAELPESARPILEFGQQLLGFTPNDLLIMARWPELLQAMAELVRVTYAPGTVGMELKRLVGLVASNAGGCAYCMAHNAHGMERDGMDPEKQAAVWEFEASPLFTDAEKSALRLAQAAGQVPNAATDLHFSKLKAHFDDRQILEIVGVIALFGFLNRWNATLSTQLEDGPLDFAREKLTPHGWEPGEHVPSK